MATQLLSAAFATLALAGAATIAVAQSTSPAPPAAPAPRWQSAPNDGWSPPEIPCNCLFRGRSYEVGTVVCMDTPQGTMLTRCDKVLNNTSWMPTGEACTISLGPGSRRLARSERSACGRPHA